MEWESLSAEEQTEVADMDPAGFSQWRAARERQQAAEWRETDARQQLEATAGSRQSVHRRAVAAFVCALLALFIWPLGAVAIILGIKVLRENPDSERELGLATWAIGLGGLFMALGIVIMVLVAT